MKKELLFLSRLPEAEYKKVDFRVRESGFPKEDGHVVEVSFQERYPPTEHTKARNNVATMTNVVMSGEILCYLLEGEGQVHVFRPGDVYRIPLGCYYVLFTFGSGAVSLVNISVPPWDEKDRDIHPLTEEDKTMLRTLGDKIVSL